MTARWAAIDRLFADVGPLPWPSDEGEAGPAGDWAEALLQAAGFAHVAASPGCRGYTMASSGRAWCGCCGWGMSARMHDAGGVGSALFALAAIARVGQSVARAIGEVVQTMFEAVLPWG